MDQQQGRARNSIPPWTVPDVVPSDYRELSWSEKLHHIVETMKDVSRQTDPQEMVRVYAGRMRGTLGQHLTLAISRRDEPRGRVRMTRNTLWEKAVDPWRQRDALPVFERGFFSEIAWDETATPVLIDGTTLPVDDPAFAYLGKYGTVFAIPQFENGEAINWVVMAAVAKDAFPLDRVPDLVLTTNLFGRVTKNLVLSRELGEALSQLNRELKAVQDIQLSLLPQESPNIPGLDVASHYQTSTMAGGDYYDFFELPPAQRGGVNQWGVLVADVSGHGTPAAVLMAIVHAIAHLMPGDALPPDRVLEFVNRELVRRYTKGNGSFVTAWYGIYNPETREMRYANAGHPPPYLCSVGANGVATIETVDGVESGLPLGIVEDVSYPAGSVVLGPGQKLAVYTDGITEAFNPAKEQFGEQRLKAALLKSVCSASETVNSVLLDLGEFAGLASRSDDRTLVVMEVCPEAE